MMGSPKDIASAILKKGKPSMAEEEEEGEGESSGAEAFAEAVKLAGSGDKEGAFEALKVAVAACSGEDY